MSDERLGTLTATVDQLQSEMDELRRRVLLGVIASCAAATIVYTYMLMRGARA